MGRAWRGTIITFSSSISPFQINDGKKCSLQQHHIIAFSIFIRAETTQFKASLTLNKNTRTQQHALPPDSSLHIFFPSGQMQGNCKIWGAHPNAPLFAYQWWGWCPCLLKPNWLWNVCSLLNDILTAYDETIVAQQSDREWLCFILSAGGPSGPGQQQHHWALYQTIHIMASFNERQPACSCSASTPLEYRTIFWCKWLSTKSFY